MDIAFYINAEVRYKFARQDKIVTAPCPLQAPFYKYKVTVELVCYMLFLRFGVHMPYYRFGQLLPGCSVAYSTKIGWAARGLGMISRLGPVLAQEILKDSKLLSMDETPFKLLDTPARIKGFKADLRALEGVSLEDGQQASSDMPQDDADMEEEIAAGVAKGNVVLKGQMWTLLNATVGLVMF